MTSQTPTPERRRVARLFVPWHLTRAAEGELQLVRLRDLSAEGTRIEHAEPVYEGEVRLVDLPPALGSARLTGRVIWTRPHTPTHPFEGDTLVSYQSALAFLEITPRQRWALEIALQILKAGV
jgi:hypothetical protein